MTPRHAAAAAFLTLLATTTRAQTFEAGWQSPTRALPTGATAVRPLADGEVAFFAQDALQVTTRGGTPRTLLSLPPMTFASFTLAPAATTLLFGESSSGDLWLVPLNAAPRRLATVPFNYDAVAWRGDLVIVSAKTGGFAAPDNDLLAVDMVTGTVDPIAVIPGASGPLTVTTTGDLIYATAANTFPPPAGGVEILRFTARQVASAIGPHTLGRGDAQLLFTGLDTAGALALDDDDDLFVTDWYGRRLIEVHDLTGGAPFATVMASYAGATIDATGLHFRTTAPPRDGARFEPFQPLPASGERRLSVHEGAFGGISQLRTLTPQRATIAAPSPVLPGRFAVDVADAAPAGLAALALALPDRSEVPWQIGQHEQPLWLAPSMRLPLATQFAALDARGRARFDLFNPGLGLALAAQVAFVDAAGRVLGSTPPVTLRLR